MSLVWECQFHVELHFERICAHFDFQNKFCPRSNERQRDSATANEYSSKVVGIKVDCNAFKIVNDKNRPKGITKLFIDDCT